ncbi:aminotransferase class-V [Nitzschia inconspicua]|uniref:Aminotransferase class-V n=1 Tax=Nitzschia inconspicua TaxID=303405 RepID=A0A9K3LLV2_9STRA|nr:aminotransferase class-V [Nitzschia inconspicua]
MSVIRGSFRSNVTQLGSKLRSRPTQTFLCQKCCHVHTQGYQAMGSFHSENVDDLMMQPDAEYQPPPLPFTVSKDIAVGTPSSSLSSFHCSNDFLLDRDTWTFLNHGAFGAALRVGYDRAAQWRYHLERQPLRYHDRDLLPHLVYSARRLAHFCRAPRDAFTLIPNVTYGLTTILRGYVNNEKKPRVILWDTTYGSLKKMAQELFPGKVTEIPVTDYFHRWNTDVSSDDPSQVFEVALRDALRKLREDHHESLDNALLIIDHTTSNTALNMPLQSLSKIGKDNNMLVLVDGAHGILAQELTLNENNLPHVDFYLGNGHKWLSCPRGVGFLYCPNQNLRDSVLKWPAVMSHGVGEGFQSRFLWDGCRDYAAALSIPAVLDHWELKNLVQVRSDLQNKLKQAVRLLSQQWHGSFSEEEVEATLLAPWDVHAPMMVLLRLPDNLQSDMPTSDDAKAIQDFLYDNVIEVPIKCIRGVLYVRLSCHVYNELPEYERLGEIMLHYRRG